MLKKKLNWENLKNYKIKNFLENYKEKFKN